MVTIFLGMCGSGNHKHIWTEGTDMSLLYFFCFRGVLEISFACYVGHVVESKSIPTPLRYGEHVLCPFYFITML